MKDKIPVWAKLLGVIFVLAVIYPLWALQRSMHYSYGYEDMVRATIRDMVKEEALKKK